MTDPIAGPGNDDRGIEHATDEVVETWQQGADGKDPTATAADFERMREGFADAATGGATTADRGATTADAAAGGATTADRGDTSGTASAGSAGGAGATGTGPGTTGTRSLDAADTFATTSTREAQLRHAGEADETSSAENRADAGAGPDG